MVNSTQRLEESKPPQSNVSILEDDTEYELPQEIPLVRSYDETLQVILEHFPQSVRSGQAKEERSSSSYPVVRTIENQTTPIKKTERRSSPPIQKPRLPKASTTTSFGRITTYPRQLSPHEKLRARSRRRRVNVPLDNPVLLHGPYSALSSCATTPFEVEGIHWTSVEHYLLAARFKEESPSLFEKIRMAKLLEALKVARQHLAHTDADWPGRRLHELRRATRAKFQQNSELIQLLIPIWMRRPTGMRWAACWRRYGINSGEGPGIRGVAAQQQPCAHLQTEPPWV